MNVRPGIFQSRREALVFFSWLAVLAAVPFAAVWAVAKLRGWL